MTDTIDHTEDAAGLYVTDLEICRRLGFSEKVGRRIIGQLEQPNKSRRPYPQRDPMFCNRRFWPEVWQWHLDYHRVGAVSPQLAPSDQPRWQENFDAPTRETSRSRHARA